MDFCKLYEALTSGDLSGFWNQLQASIPSVERRIQAVQDAGIKLKYHSLNPSGWYWTDGNIEQGPFPTADDALLDAYMAYSVDSEVPVC